MTSIGLIFDDVRVISKEYLLPRLLVLSLVYTYSNLCWMRWQLTAPIESVAKPWKQQQQRYRKRTRNESTQFVRFWQDIRFTHISYYSFKLFDQVDAFKLIHSYSSHNCGALVASYPSRRVPPKLHQVPFDRILSTLFS